MRNLMPFFVLGAAAVGLAYMLSDKAKAIVNDSLNTVTKPLGSMMADVSAWFNGHTGVQGGFAYVVFRKRDFTTGIMQLDRYHAALAMNPGNKAILDMTLTPYRQLISPYADALLAHELIAVTETGTIEYDVKE
jgi:hypothetical protein